MTDILSVEVGELIKIQLLQQMMVNIYYNTTHSKYKYNSTEDVSVFDLNYELSSGGLSIVFTLIRYLRYAKNNAIEILLTMDNYFPIRIDYEGW